MTGLVASRKAGQTGRLRKIRKCGVAELAREAAHDTVIALFRLVGHELIAAIDGALAR